MFNKNKLKAQMALVGISGRELSELLEMDESTFYRKLNADGAFSRKQINDMIRILHIDDPMDIFFCSETCVNAI